MINTQYRSLRQPGSASPCLLPRPDNSPGAGGGRRLARHALAALALLLAAQSVNAEPYPPTGQRLRDLADMSDFQIGYASRFDFRNQPQAALYEEIVKAEFNIVTPENSVKWEKVHTAEGVFDFTDMDELVAFADDNGMELHGHPFLWHNQLPPWVLELDGFPEQLEARMIDHITTIGERYAGRIQVWDVINEGLEEPADSTELRDDLWLSNLGKAYMRTAFETARAADPAAKLIYNDFYVGWLTPKSEAMYALIKELVEDGVPIDGVGFQMHITAEFTEFDEFSDNMRRYADLGLDVYVTEFDVKVLNKSDDYPLQGEIYEKVLVRCLAEPACKAFQVWGVDDFHSFIPQFDPLPFDDDFNIKPAYYGMQRALSTRVLNVAGDQLTHGDVLAQVDVRPDFQTLMVRYANDSAVTVNAMVRSGSPDGDVVATVSFEPTGGMDQFAVTETSLSLGSANSADLHVMFDDESAAVPVDFMLLRDPTLPMTDPDVVTRSSSGGSGALGLFVLLLGFALSARQRRALQQS